MWLQRLGPCRDVARIWDRKKEVELSSFVWVCMEDRYRRLSWRVMGEPKGRGLKRRDEFRSGAERTQEGMKCMFGSEAPAWSSVHMPVPHACLHAHSRRGEACKCSPNWSPIFHQARPISAWRPSLNFISAPSPHRGCQESWETGSDKKSP